MIKIKITPRKLTRLMLLLFLIGVGQLTANKALVKRELASLDPSLVLGEWQEPTEIDAYVVTRVVDGDTFKIDAHGKEDTVRLLAIDTPELNRDTNEPECYALEAKLYLESRILNRSATLVADTLQPDRDRYGRLLRYVYLSDGSLVNADIVAEGYGKAYTQIKSDQLDYVLNLEQQAKVEQLGMWSACEQE